MSRILVLEDDEPQQRLVHGLLVDEGHEVCIVSSLDACLLHRADHDHDLIITDLLVPEGLVPLSELADGESPVLIVSAHPEGVAIAEDARVEILSKPYDIEEFVQAVTRLTAARPPAGR